MNAPEHSRGRTAQLRRVLTFVLGVISVLHVTYYGLGWADGVAGGAEKIGLLLGLAATALALRVWLSGATWELALLGLLGTSQATTIALLLTEAPTPLSYRPFLVLTASLYLALPILLIGLAVPKPDAGAIVILAVSVTTGVLVVETVGSRLLSQQAGAPIAGDPDYVVRYLGARDQHPEMGPIPIANSVTEMVYPDNPRGYFRTRDASWRLTHRPSSEARLDLSGEEVGVLIDRAGDPTPWHIQLSHHGLSVQGGAEYQLSLRVRASGPREFRFGVGMAHPPFESLGLFDIAQAGTEWTRVERTFTANRSDDSVQVTFNLGGDTANIFVSDLTLAQSPGGAVVQSRVEPEHYVSYEWNSRGCRAAEYPIPATRDAFRVVALGDSYTQGVGVHIEDVVTSVMERLLRERASETGDPRTFEVMGCGVSGFSTREERLYYEERASAYQPDLVLVMMVWNDDRSFIDDVNLGFVHRPKAWEQLLHTGYLVQKRRHARPEPDFSRSMAELAQLHERVKEDGADLAVVVFNNNGGGLAWNRLLVSADSTGEALGVPILDLRPVLVTGGDPAELLVHPLDRHPNEIAHRMAAEAIVEWLEREGLTEPRPEGQRSRSADAGRQLWE